MALVCSPYCVMFCMPGYLFASFCKALYAGWNACGKIYALYPRRYRNILTAVWYFYNSNNLPLPGISIIPDWIVYNSNSLTILAAAVMTGRIPATAITSGLVAIDIIDYDTNRRLFSKLYYYMIVVSGDCRFLHSLCITFLYVYIAILH